MTKRERALEKALIETTAWYFSLLIHGYDVIPTPPAFIQRAKRLVTTDFPRTKRKGKKK